MGKKYKIIGFLVLGIIVTYKSYWVAVDEYRYFHYVIPPESYDIPIDHLGLIVRKTQDSSYSSGCSVIYDFPDIHVTRENPNKIIYKSVKMGRYPGENSEPEPVEWLIIDEKRGKTLLLSKYYLDAVPYDNKIENISWEKSQLRSWLNEDFYQQAFDQREQEAIKENFIISDFYPILRWKTILPSRITKDKVFVLDVHEKILYLGFAENSMCSEPTQYAKQHFISGLEYDWIRFGAVPNISCQICWSWEGEFMDYYPGFEYHLSPRERSDDKVLYVRPAIWVDSDYVKGLQ